MDVPTLSFDATLDIWHHRQKRSGSIFFEAADELDGFLEGEISSRHCACIDNLFGAWDSKRTPIDFGSLQTVWSEKYQLLARGLNGFDISANSLEDEIFVPGPLKVEDGLGIVFNRLSSIYGVGPTNAAKIISLNNSSGVVMWDDRNIRSLWRIKGDADAFVDYQAKAKRTIHSWVEEAQVRMGLEDRADAVNWLETLCFQPEWGAKFKTRRRLAKLFDEYAIGLPDWFRAGNYWVVSADGTRFFRQGPGLKHAPVGR